MWSAGNSDDDKIEFLENEDGPCPVCGVAGSNCKGEGNEYDGIQFLPPIIGEDPLATFTVPHRIYEETQVGSRTVKKLLHPKGARIRPEEAKRLGLLPS